MRRYKFTTRYGTIYTTAISEKKAVSNCKWRLRHKGVYVADLEFAVELAP